MEDSDHPARILLVDDEDYLRNGVKRILQIEGFEVETAENGAEGIKKGTEFDFDVALLDLKMPDISGIEVLRMIRQARPNTICFMATAYASYETAVEATKLGAEGYI
ncbi:MAG: response regulator, partial [Ignavibacteriaceae bacterium]|nr:response regulator [Ignavibacteriaceae bacterium]